MKKFLIYLCFFSIKSYSHEAILDSWGCHHNIKSGVYHCHNQSSQKSDPPVCIQTVFSAVPGGFVSCFFKGDTIFCYLEDKKYNHLQERFHFGTKRMFPSKETIQSVFSNLCFEDPVCKADLCN